MSKLIYSEDFKARFINASKNGSVIAKDIWKAINLPDNVKDSVKFNYLTTVRVRHGSDGTFTAKSVKITCCKKDFSNANNPEHGSPVGMWRPENRSEISIPDLVAAFKSLDGKNYSSDDISYAVSILCVDEPLKLGIYSRMQDIERGYNGENYSDTGYGERTLHNSCMRGADTARVAADFYANFAGVSIILATGAVSSKVYGRAILWPSITLMKDGEQVTGKFLDRTYFAFDAVLPMIRNYAKENGVRFRKWKNTYCDKATFVDMDANNELFESRADVKVPVNKWHKEGSPYVDTFSYLHYVDGEFMMSNYRRSSSCVAELGTTGTRAYVIGKICPVCGKVHGNDVALCRDCASTYLKDTPVGRIYVGKVNSKHEPVLPKKFSEDSMHLRNI